MLLKDLFSSVDFTSSREPLWEESWESIGLKMKKWLSVK